MGSKLGRSNQSFTRLGSLIQDRIGFSRQAGLWMLVLSIVTVSVILRFNNLAGEVYWGDEVYSSLRIFGHTTQALRETIAQGIPVSAQVVQSFQALVPSQGIPTTLQSLALEDAHLAPLYFVLARIWSNYFGDSVGSLRSLSVIFGLLLIPGTYYLASELFSTLLNKPTAKMQPMSTEVSRRAVQAMAQWAMVLVAVSPLQLLAAREARFYSLWVLTTVLSSVFLLRALKRPSWIRWGLFTIALTLNFYSTLLGVITFAGYLIYVLIAYWRERRIIWRFGIASMSSLLTFAPWIVVFLTRRIVDNRDTEGRFSVIDGRLAIRNWFALVRRLFIDFDTTPSTSALWAIGLTVVALVGAGLVIYGFRQLLQHSGVRVWLFIVMLIVPLPMYFFTLSLQGLLPSRYLLPSYIGLQLILAYLLGYKTVQRSRPLPFWSIVMVGIVSIGLLSCAQVTSTTVWWNKYYSNCNPEIARIVNQASQPLVISDGTGGVAFDHGLSNVVSVARLVRPETQFQVTLETAPPISIASGFSDRLVVTPSQILHDRLEQQYPGKLQPMLELEDPYRGSKVCLWRLLP
jgi:uncharacterized membrane protein